VSANGGFLRQDKQHCITKGAWEWCVEKLTPLIVTISHHQIKLARSLLRSYRGPKIRSFVRRTWKQGRARAQELMKGCEKGSDSTLSYTYCGFPIRNPSKWMPKLETRYFSHILHLQYLDLISIPSTTTFTKSIPRISDTKLPEVKVLSRLSGVVGYSITPQPLQFLPKQVKLALTLNSDVPKRQGPNSDLGPS
jgi:hypothetical protein